MESTEIIDHLLSAKAIADNVDLVTLILLRVPPRSLVRFKCVSKHWFSLISDSKFSNNHTRKSLKPSVSGLYFDSNPLISFETKSPNPQLNLPNVDFLSTPHGVKAKILHSCNGLMLCSRGSEVIVCNLTTQKFKVIPSISCPSFQSSADKFLSFNPMSSPHYKVVFIKKENFSISVYSSESGMWKDIHVNGSQFNPFIDKVLCDGAIYWMIKKNILARFDIDEESFKTIQIPTEPVVFAADFFLLYFGECDGHLLLIQTRTPRTIEYRFFEMDMQNFSWNMKYNVNVGLGMNISLGKLRKMFYQHLTSEIECLTFINLKRGDEEETPALLLVCATQIVSYNPNNNCWEILPYLPHGPHEFHKRGRGLLRVQKYIQSLASV